MGQTCIESKDTRFKICGSSRRIKSLTGRKLILVQRDHNSTKMVFEMPTCLGGEDVTEGRIEVYWENGAAKGKQTLTDLQADDTVAVCSWVVPGEATQSAGPLAFGLSLVRGSEDEPDYIWSTPVCYLAEVLPCLRWEIVKKPKLDTPLIWLDIPEQLAAPTIRFVEMGEGGTTAVLGKATIGTMLLGDDGSTVRLDAPTIELVSAEQLGTPAIWLA